MTDMNAQQPNPRELLEISGSYWKTCTLHAAVSLDIFTILDGQGLKSEDVAGKIDGDNRAVSILLNALVAMQLLSKTAGIYCDTPVSTSYLSKNSQKYIGHIIIHHHHMVNTWSQLDQAVKSGEAVRTKAPYSDEELRENFLMGMHNLAMNLAPQLVPEIDLSGREQLLDLGGGPGTYAIHFCLTNPGLKATVFDLPETRPYAEGTIEKFGLSDRINFVEGNFLEDDIPGSYDAAWLSHILHGEGPEDCRRIIQKAVSVLQPGAMLIVHDFILNNSMDGPLFPALFSLNMLLGTSSGQAYSEQQIMDMFARAGLKDIQRVSIHAPTDSGIITGTV